MKSRVLPEVAACLIFSISRGFLMQTYGSFPSRLASWTVRSTTCKQQDWSLKRAPVRYIQTSTWRPWCSCFFLKQHVRNRFLLLFVFVYFHWDCSLLCMFYLFFNVISQLLRMRRLLGDMSVPETLFPTRCLWMLDTTSVVDLSSPACGWSPLLTATSRKCTKTHFDHLQWEIIAQEQSQDEQHWIQNSF